VRRDSSGSHRRRHRRQSPHEKVLIRRRLTSTRPPQCEQGTPRSCSAGVCASGQGPHRRARTPERGPAAALSFLWPPRVDATTCSPMCAADRKRGEESRRVAGRRPVAGPGRAPARAGDCGAAGSDRERTRMEARVTESGTSGRWDFVPAKCALGRPSRWTARSRGSK
jgi:hypothetical protein